MPPAATTAGVRRRVIPNIYRPRGTIPPISAPGGSHPTATAPATAGITYRRSTEAVGFSGATGTTTVRRAATHAARPTRPPAPTPTIIIPIGTGTTVKAKARSAARIALGFGATATAKTLNYNLFVLQLKTMLCLLAALVAAAGAVAWRGGAVCPQ